ncbi:hypothetical protein [Natronospira bacteriovora]|uniref:Uncharacterized protein n=1 Tax=Natronospira bacteriovora TaxID=3069753 RepID=A0ABU0W6D0_9GAMM|nr:hypothetical protein [Natronospira sp. AB-CW4]MDQ2069582.1 hypothetical protein [Natronospira sp. AB-CW4]
MTAFLAVIALGAIIAFAIAGWRSEQLWVRRLGRAGVVLLVLGTGVEVLVNTVNWPPLTPGFSFVIGAGLGFGVALPGMILYAMPR